MITTQRVGKAFPVRTAFHPRGLERWEYRAATELHSDGVRLGWLVGIPDTLAGRIAELLERHGLADVPDQVPTSDLPTSDGGAS